MGLDIEKLKANLAWYDIKVVEETESWTDDEGEEVRVFECIKDNQSVLAEYFTESETVDIYYKETHCDIFSGILKSVA